MATQFSHSLDEELIAAYVDGDVTAEEQQRVEAAMAVNENIAWEVNTLRQTVALLNEMPRVALPRSFVLTEDHVKDVLQARRGSPTAPSAVEVEAPAESPWQRLLIYLIGGNPVFRNAAAVAAVLLLLVVVAEASLLESQIGGLAPAGSASSPSIQVTVVGGSLSDAADTEGAKPAPEDLIAKDEDSVTVMGDASDQESGDTSADIGATSTDSEDAEAVVTTPQPDVDAPVKSAAGDTSEESPPSLPTAVSAAPGAYDIEGEPRSQASLRIWFRYARIVLVVAVIGLLLLSRYRPREIRA